MRVLVIGGGGREHALCWKLRQSPRLTALYCAPGYAGIARVAECVPVSADDLNKVLRFAREQAMDLTVVGPGLPLTMGLVDGFAAAGVRAFGPTAAAARLEGSKAFTKELLRHARVPTAFFGVFTEADDAVRYVNEVGAPVVVKADGLAGGKGVFICRTVAEAEEAIDELMRGRLFGDAGSRVVVEEFLEGEEVSFMALSDGTTVVPLATSQDHKRVLDGDQGPNTGGMGACSPAPVVTAALEAGWTVTDGGRVLGVTALGDTIDAEVAGAYAAVVRIRWPGMHFRRDIGHRALARERKDGQHGGA